MEAHATCHVCYHRGFVLLCVLRLSSFLLNRESDATILMTTSTKTQCFWSTIHKRVSIMSVQGPCDLPRSLISPKSLRPFPSFHPSHLSFVHRSLPPSALLPSWRPQTRYSPHSLSSVSYSVPFRCIGTWKVNFVQRAPSSRFPMN